MRIRIQNFQSIVDATIDLDGIVVVTGQSNSGKTALIRAVKAFCTGLGSPGLVRAGSKVASVAIDHAGHQIVWERSRTAQRYVVDGEVYPKTNRRPLVEIAPPGTPIPFVYENVLGCSVLPQIVCQGDPAFPFGFSEAATFKLFQRFLGTAAIQEIVLGLKAAVADLAQGVKTQNAVIERLVTDIASGEAALNAFPSQNRLANVINTLSSADVDLTRFEALRAGLRDEKSYYYTINNSVAAMNSFVEAILGCSRVRVSVFVLYEKVRTYFEISTCARSLIQTLAREALQADSLLSRFDSPVRSWISGARPLVVGSGYTKRLGDLFERGHLAARTSTMLRAQLAQTCQAKRFTEVRVNALGAMSQVQAVSAAALTRLFAEIERGDRLGARVKTLASQRSEMEQELAKIEICPLCGSRLYPNSPGGGPTGLCTGKTTPKPSSGTGGTLEGSHSDGNDDGRGDQPVPGRPADDGPNPDRAGPGRGRSKGQRAPAKGNPG